MNGNRPAEITTRNDIARDIIAGFAAVTPTLGGRLAAHRHRARRPARRPRRPRPGTSGTRGGAAGPREPARGDPRDPRGRRRGRARPARLPARRTRLHRRPGRHEAAVMSTYRQIRRQTRRARRRGLQPIVVIDSPFPVPAGVLLARLAWRYRSEIAPATTAGAVLARRLVAPRTGTRTGGRGCSPSPTWPRSRWSCSARASDWPGSPSASTRPAAVLAAGGWLAVAGAARPVHLADAASPRHRRAPARGPVVGAPAPPGAGHACNARSPRGPTSPRRSACPAPRSSPPPWTCGDGGRGSAWPAGRPSPT